MMTIKELLDAKEGENIEFKEAKGNFPFDELLKYASAIANRGGGKVVFGITDRRPRRVVGSQAFKQPEQTRKNLIDRLRINVDFELMDQNGLRILIFSFASRPAGLPVQAKDGVAWWRDGDSLIPMPPEVLREIYNEAGHDFSSDICPKATFADLDKKAIDIFRETWVEKRALQRIRNLSYHQLLEDCGAAIDGNITYAALILFGTEKAIRRHLSQAETIFEYRSSEAAGPSQQREEFQKGFFLYHDRLWELINLRNDKQHYQDGLFIFDISTFNERVVREVVLNAVCHRNYQYSGSIFIRQYQDRLVVESPGGFLPGITTDNILDKQAPRNRLIAEILSRCGLVERSGQGMDLIYELSIKEAKALPDFTGTDSHLVRITLNGMIVDKSMLLLINKIGKDALNSFSTVDFLIINMVSREQKIPDIMRQRAKRLIDLGIIERVGQNRFIFSRRYYNTAGKSGVYTRLSGLDKDYNIGLLLKHIESKGDIGTPFRELQQVLPSHSRGQIKSLLNAMRSKGKIVLKGSTRNALWYSTERLPQSPILLDKKQNRLYESQTKTTKNNKGPIGQTKADRSEAALIHDGVSAADVLLDYIRSHKDGTPIRELHRLLPEYSRERVKVLLRRMRADGMIFSQGTTRNALWFLADDLAH